jgi:1,2-phenylacetyl-CoA epoxidase catalytic subunit
VKGYQSIITNPLTEKKRRPSSGRRGVGRPHVTRRQQACLTVPRPLLSPLFSYADYSFFSFLFEGISVVNVKSLQNSSSKPREPNKHTTQQNSEFRIRRYKKLMTLMERKYTSKPKQSQPISLRF